MLETGFFLPKTLFIIAYHIHKELANKHSPHLYAGMPNR